MSDGAAIAIAYSAVVGTVLNTIIGLINATIVRKTSEVINTLEKNTNSIKDALVKVTAENEFQKGHTQGKLEEQAKKGKETK